MFEAHNVVRESLEHRMRILQANDSTDYRGPDTSRADYKRQIAFEVQTLRDIARTKCENVVKEITAIVKRHLHSPFFEWDASLVRGEHLLR